MANMSYCRFENTYGDLKDCVTAMEEAMDEGVSLKKFVREMSEEELMYFQSITNMCKRLMEAYDNMTLAQLMEIDDEDEYDLSDKCFEA